MAKIEKLAGPATRKRVDRARLALAVREILLAIGDDPERSGLRETPERVADLYADLFAGIGADPADELAESIADEEERASGVILVRDIPFHSVCEHHLLPFSGVAHVGYLPNGHVVGLGKLARVVDTCARRLQIQERLTRQIADAVERGVRPRAVGVIVEASHLCMAMRGLKTVGATVTTSELRGEFATDPVARAEFVTLARAKCDE
ncbi:MAG: GTP cyclohydrolase I FolE [Chloroflexi bacterium]|nr:GTP cyclohydrolase I FolE [Chloroflexota bacterium]